MDAGPASQRRRAAMDKRSFYSAMHKSMDSPLTGRLPTPCPQTYAQRLSFEIMRIAYPPPLLLLLLSIHSYYVKDILCIVAVRRGSGYSCERLCLLRYKRTRKMRQIMIKSAQKPVSMYAYHLPNETHRYGILIIIGTTIWLTLQEPGGDGFYGCKAKTISVSRLRP